MKITSIIGMIGKVIGILILTILLIAVIFIVVMVLIVKSNDAYKGDYLSILKNSDSSAPKALIVFQPSKSKTSVNVANQIAKGLNDAGYEVTITYAGKHVSSDISEYSLVAFGSPVFVGKPSKMITDTMKKISDFTGKTIILYSVGKSSEEPEIDVLKQCLNGKAPDYTEKFIADDDANDDKAYELGLKVSQESSGTK